MPRQDRPRRAPQPTAPRPERSQPVVTRRRFLGTAAALAAGAALVGPTAYPVGATPLRRQARVQVGYIPLLACGPLFVANDRGYLREAGLDVEMIRFNSGAEMVVALGTGELAAGYGAISPGLFNAWSRGVRTALVADGGRLIPGYSNLVVVVRSDLVDAIRTPADLRGRRVGMSVVGASIDYVMRNLLEQNGLGEDDVQPVRLPSADVTAGLAGRTLDAAGVSEPFAALAEQNGIARKWLGGEQIVPGMEISGLLLADPLARDRGQAVAVVTAWLRGVRDFLPGQNSDASVIESLNRWTSVPPEVIRRAGLSYADPNGSIDLDDVRKQHAFWLRQGVITSAAPIDERTDLSFAEAAVQALGRA
jgi:ABC-type nitrate/sulfonate/bicarbonate transport system substrate-binding protein